LSSHFPLDHDSSENFSNSILYPAENWMRDTVFLSFETQNWMRLLRHYLNFLYELNFVDQYIFNVSPWTRNCPNIYNTHETHQPNL